MSNIAALLKSEIARVARKEMRAQTDGLRKATSSYRAEIAALKRRVQDLEKELRLLKKGTERNSVAPAADDSESNLRFSAKGIAAHRKRLGLSAREFGALVGASSLSIYKWEKGAVRPRASFLPAIAMVRTMGRREAAARLQALH